MFHSTKRTTCLYKDKVRQRAPGRLEVLSRIPCLKIDRARKRYLPAKLQKIPEVVERVTSANPRAPSVRLTAKKTQVQRSVLAPSGNRFCGLCDSEWSQPKEKFERNASVYDSNEKDGSGRPKGNKGTRYWICCVEWDLNKKRWFYKLKDAPFPDGKDVRWVEERYLHEWHV